MTVQIKTLYLFSGVMQSDRHRSPVDGDVRGGLLCEGEVVSEGCLTSCSGSNAALASVSAATIT